MNTSSIVPDDLNGSSYLKISYQAPRYFFGRIWTTISNLPHQFYQLILSIKRIVARSLFSSDSNEKQSAIQSPLSPKEGNSIEEKDPLGFMDLETLGFAGDASIGKTKESTPSSVTPKNNQVETQVSDNEGSDLGDDDSDVDNDPLEGMESFSNPYFGAGSPIDGGDYKQITVEEVEEKIVRCATDVLQPTGQLIKDAKDLKTDTWDKCLDLIERIDKELDGLKIYTSKFIAIPRAHLLVQRGLNALTKKRTFYEIELCRQIQSNYTPNPAILQDGNCLFWSINDLLKKENKPIYYRKLAAEYIRSHTEKFESAVKDVLKEPLIKATIREYTAIHGGLQSYCDKLDVKLNRPFKDIDFYTDCLVHTKLWGGNTEVLALSEQLQVQILTFTQKENSTWRFDAREGAGRFKDKPPLLLYYNGVNHYQSLIPKKK